MGPRFHRKGRVFPGKMARDSVRLLLERVPWLRLRLVGVISCSVALILSARLWRYAIEQAL